MARRGTALLLGGACAWFAAGEAWTRLWFDRVPAVQAGYLEDWKAAARPTRPDHQTLLLVGNSLLGTDVDREILTAVLGPAVDVHMLAVDATRYTDWYFGAKRLFSAGARPTAIVLAIGGSQMAETRIRGDYSARYLWNLRDVIPAARAARLDRNRTASLLIANVSAFWASRVEIRNGILRRLLPGAPTLLSRIARRPADVWDPRDIEQIATPRLAEFASLARAHGSSFWFLVPPRPGAQGEAEAVVRAGRAAGVVVIATAESSLGAASFSDGIHLTPPAARLFTREIAVRIRSLLTPDL